MTVRAAGLALSGEIRDYCPAGLYLAFARPVSAETIDALGAAGRVQIDFSRDDSGVVSAYRLLARIARSLPTGLGLQVSQMPADVLEALSAASREMSATRVGAPGGRAVATAAHDAMSEQCNALFGAFLERVLREFVDQVHGDLARAAGQAAGAEQRARFGAAERELASRRGVLKDAFDRSIRESQNLAGRVRQTVPADESPETLTLVDDAQFEDWLNLSTVAHRLEADLSWPLAELYRRYGMLFGVSVDRSNCPVGPEVICRSFQDALHALELSNPARGVAYRTFGGVLATQCPPLYAALNAVLAPLDAAAPSAGRTPARAASAVPRKTPGEPASGEPASGEPASGRPSAGQPQAGGESIAEILDAVRRLQAQHLSRSDGAGPPPDTGPRTVSDTASRNLPGAPAGGAAGRSPGGHGRVDLRQAVGPLHHAAYDAMNDAVNGAASDAPPGTRAASQRLLHLIESLLQTPESAAGTGWVGRPMPSPGAGGPPTADLSALGAAIDALPRITRGAGADPAAPTLSHRLAGGPALPAPYRQALDTADGLIGRALRESDGVPEIQALLERLERPLLKLALRDASFLESADHPARRTVDLLDQFAMATDASGRFVDAALHRFLHQLVERLAGQEGDDPTLFEVAQRTLARLLEPVRQARAQRVAEMQQACESRDRIRQARARIDDALVRVLDGRPLPQPVWRLLEAGWRQHQVLLDLRAGPQHEASIQAQSVLERLIAWLQPGYPPGPDFGKEVAAMLARLAPALFAVNMDREQPVAVVDELDRLLLTVAAGGAAPAALTAPPALALDVQESSVQAAGEPSLSAGSGHAAGMLRPGDWCLVEQAGARTPMQLVWESAGGDRCAFATRSAMHKLEMTIGELVRAMDAGRIEPWSDQDRPLLERSEFGLLDEGRKALRRHAIQDPASGLLNRKGFLQHLQRVGRRASDAGSYLVGILEFDQMRLIYNACGVAAAEGLIRRLAQETRECLGPDALVAGFRDDTLAVLLPEPSRAVGDAVIDTLLQRLADWRFEHAGQRYSIGLNIGVSRFEPGLTRPDEAVRRSDAACIAAKALGRNRVHGYESGSAQVKHHETLADWAGRIDGMLEGDGMFLRCQMVMPIGDVAASLPYYEILLGLETEPGVPASPMSFVPAVERLKRSHELDLWVMRQVFDWVAGHRGVFDAIGGFAINVSPLSLSSPEILAFLHRRLSDPQLPASKISFEITETAAIESYGAAQHFIREIRPYGCKFSLDDFGSGYTSYAHLKNLRADSLKIDGSFVKDMATVESDYAMVKSMHEIARSLGMRSVAEYVETPQILAKLREIGVDYAQGYAIHRPCPIGELTGT